MSMIDCKVNVEKKPDPKGDRVLLTFEWVVSIDYSDESIQAIDFSGKFLPYAKWWLTL